MSPTNYGEEALETLTVPEISFLQSLPKAELHAHLNGSIPLHVLGQLARDFQTSNSSNFPDLTDAVKTGIENLEKGFELNELNDFFGLFPAIYALTSTPSALGTVSRAVLQSFLDGSTPQCTFLELRSTPRANESMTRREYVETVLAEVEKYPAEKAALIVSIDRRMDEAVVDECISLAVALKQEGRRVVGIDLCGDPMAGNMTEFSKYFQRAKSAGLGVTLHIAETKDNPDNETLYFLNEFAPSRLGHATFLNDEALEIVFKKDIAVEICLSSNLLCKTVKSLGDHHIRFHLERNHRVAICTDDVLPFRTNLLNEYALLFAKPPSGLGLSEDEVRRIAQMSLDARFKP